MIKICPKLDQGKVEDKEIIKKLLDEGFTSFELHTNPNSNWTELSDILSNCKLQVEAVHMPNRLKSGEWFNLCIDDDVAKKSTDLFFDVIQFSKEIQSKKIVFHTWVVHYMQDIEAERKKGRKNLVYNLIQLNNDEVKLLPEVSPRLFWTQNILDLCPVACTAEDFYEIINQVSQKTVRPNIGVAADIDHIYRTAVCDVKIYSNFIKALREEKTKEEILESIVCEPMLNYHNRSPKDTNILVRNEIYRLFSKLDQINYPIQYIHTCGVAHPNIKGKKASSVISVGEHIPVGYVGPSSAGDITYSVNDVMDHKFYLKHIKGKDAIIILEFNPRKDYDFVEQIINSRKYLEKELDKV